MQLVRVPGNRYLAGVVDDDLPLARNRAELLHRVPGELREIAVAAGRGAAGVGTSEEQQV
jgi:hypothetical protein